MSTRPFSFFVFTFHTGVFRLEQLHIMIPLGLLNARVVLHLTGDNTTSDVSSDPTDSSPDGVACRPPSSDEA